MINPINAKELTASIQRDYQNAAKYAQLQSSNESTQKANTSIIESLRLFFVSIVGQQKL